jgi:hypothetical protein
LPAGRWSVRINSADQEWRGPGNALAKEINAGDPLRLSAQSFVVLER